MIKALSAVAIAVFAAAAVTILPSFAPPVAASAPLVLAKADRLPLWRLRQLAPARTGPTSSRVLAPHKLKGNDSTGAPGDRRSLVSSGMSSRFC
jgi:hypothetical protein